MSWWEYVIVAGVLLAGIYAFLVLTGYVTKFLSSGDDNTADTMYGNYADSLRKQRRYARQHGRERKDDEGPRSRDAAAVHSHAGGKAAVHHSDGPVDRAA